jgi:hypothetical protein
VGAIFLADRHDADDRLSGPSRASLCPVIDFVELIGSSFAYLPNTCLNA